MPGGQPRRRGDRSVGGSPNLHGARHACQASPATVQSEAMRWGYPQPRSGVGESRAIQPSPATMPIVDEARSDVSVAGTDTVPVALL